MSGLFPVPVCIVHDLVNAPGVGGVMKDWQNEMKSKDYYHTKDPCSCKNTYAMFPNGTRRNFIDFVSDDIADSLTDCKESGYYRTTKNNHHR